MNYLKILSALCIVMIINGCCITRPNCNPEGGNFTYGPELSFRTSSYWGEDAKDQDVKHVGSMGFGGYVHWVFCEDYPDMGFYSGLYYNQHGAKYEFSSDDTNKDRLHYLTIPFTFTYRVYDGIKVEVGPDLSFLLAAKQKNTYMGQTETYDFKDDVSKVQLGFNLAASYTHDQSGLGGFIRYNGGFTNVPSSDNDIKLKNGGISFGARYRINHLFYKK